MTKIQFPINWRPYPFQVPLWNYLLDGGKRAIAVWHRRAGKDILGLNWIVAAALKEIGTYWYIYPTYAQAKRSVWDGMTLDGKAYMSYIPDELIKENSQSKQKIVLINGSIIQFVGSDRPLNLRGGGIKGAVISEYSYCNPKSIASLEPMFERSRAWVLYLYTPSDDPRLTHGEELYNKYKDDKNTYCEVKNIEQTTDHDGRPLYDLKELKKGKGEMSAAEKRREYYCDFEAYKYSRAEEEGNIFAADLNIAKIAGRIGFFPHDPAYSVDTYWDIGISNFTTIWFCQEKNDEIVVIDFYYNQNKPIDFYLNVLRSRGGYQYAKNVLPHDMNRRDPVTLEGRLTKANEMAEKLCFPPFIIGSKYRNEERLEETRNFLGKCKIDSKRCHSGIEGLYDYDPSKRSKRAASHSSFECDVVDSFSYMAMQVKTREERKAEYRILDSGFPKNITGIDNKNPFDF